MKRLIASLAVLTLACAGNAQRPSSDAEVPAVRAQLELRYAENNAAYLREDLAAILALRHPEFHALPDGTVRDAASMATYIEGFLNGVTEWRSLTITIDSLTVRGDTAWAETSQHVDRMALRPDNLVHHVVTSVKQREAWIRREDGQWYMWRVDNLRDQRRWVDGIEG